MNYKNFFRAMVAGALLLAIAGTVQAVGLGISPSLIKVDHMLRGSHYEKTIVLSRAQADQTLDFEIVYEGATKDWMSTNYGKRFTIPKDVQRFPINVLIDVPGETANGKYEGKVIFKGTPSTKAAAPATGNVVSFTLNAILEIKLNVVGEQVLEYTVSSIKINNVEEGSPVSIYILVNNTGNVAARPTRLHVDFYDKFQKTLLESADVTEMNSVEAFKQGNVIADVTTKLGVGQYWAFVKVYKDSEVVMEEKVPFDILEVGTLEKKGEFKELLMKGQVNVGEVQKFTGLFENQGATPVFAKLIVEIYRGNQLVDVVEGEQIRVERNKTENVVAYYTPSTAGNYVVKAHVSFDGKSTDVKTANMLVRGIITSMIVTAVETQGLLILVIVLLIILALVLQYSKKRKK